ncbi:MAG: phosphatase PAP2 family protein [Ruminococcaceae bacterium]|nr:phosphatase PAP2 family protein [Oscillospiraceae bacterium]
MIFDYYKDFSFKKLTEKKFTHIWLLVYWPLFYLAFNLLEQRKNIDWIQVEIGFDKSIPFCEYFIIPYYFWFLYLVWMLVYTFFYDIDSFKKYMAFIIASYTITCIIYFFFPTEQNLRPVLSQGENIFKDMVYHLHNTIDNPKNVCPSLHVTGSMAVLFTAWHSKRYSTTLSKFLFIILTVLISISTVFLKQHSIIDTFAALIMCFILYPFIFHFKPFRKLKTA